LRAVPANYAIWSSGQTRCLDVMIAAGDEMRAA
jgi:hypothetical protein